MEIISNNTNTLAPDVYAKLRGRGHAYSSRNGPVLRIFEPFTVCLQRPWERVNFSAVRDANPFFHLIEAMAMLAPVNHVGLMSHFASSMKQFSDDGHSYNAFYGTRARCWELPSEEVQSGIGSHQEHREVDQLDAVIKELLAKPDSRQCVVQLWDPEDLLRTTKDKACNLAMLFDIIPGGLDYSDHGDGPTTPTQVVRMTSFNRSNDAVLGGISGANVVHLSFFHEYVARGVGIAQGSWWHVSNNLHAYTDQAQWQRVSTVDDNVNEYANGRLPHEPLFKDRAVFDREVKTLMSWMVDAYETLSYIPGSFQVDRGPFTEPFLADTVLPAFNAWQTYKRGERSLALLQCQKIHAADWRLACTRWMGRRQK